MKDAQQEERFQSLIEEHKRILYKICNCYCKNRDDRDDLAQEITIHLWNSFSTFRESSRFSTWMYRVALNVAISFYRRESTRTRNVVSTDIQLLNIADTAAEQTEDVKLLYHFIEGLDPMHKALMLLYLDGYLYQEIASVMGISETNVASKISRLKQRLKQEFDQTE